MAGFSLTQPGQRLPGTQGCHRLMETTWSHGYYPNALYNCGFYREMAPNWLDFAALIKGHHRPLRREGEPCRYLELGSGMGLHLCLLAAAYPEGTSGGRRPRQLDWC